MRVDRAYIGQPDKKVECESVLTAIETFRQRLVSVNLAAGASGPSHEIKKALDSIVHINGWEKKFLFSREAHSSLPQANYTVNYLFVEPECQCGLRHKVFFHMCFDNRQAIGTHILRFKLAMESNGRLKSDKPASVAVVLDANSKSKFGWDNSAATYEEFAHALELEYAEIIDLPLNFLIIRG